MKQYINLLPSSYHRRVLVRWRLMQWSLAWIACFLVGIGIWWQGNARLGDSLDLLQKTRREYAPLARVVQQRDRMQAELRQLQAKGTVYGQLRDERPMATLIGLASHSVQRCAGRLVLHKLSFDREDPHGEAADTKNRPPRKRPAAPPTAQAGKSPWGAVTFAGEAMDNVAVATFVVALRDCGLFRRVELKSSLEKKSSESPLHSYTLECDI